jgi:hypothetical protein
MTDTMKSNNSKRTTAFAVVAGILIVLGTAGCDGKAGAKHVSHGEEFVGDRETVSAVDKFAAAQISSGARTDATLRAYHFDGAQLNSLGRDKLRSMLKDDDACEPMVVYLDLKGTGEVTARREAVSAFLMDEGLLESQLQLKEGSNPANTTPAVSGLKALAAGEGAAAPAAPTGMKSGATPTK